MITRNSFIVLFFIQLNSNKVAHSGWSSVNLCEDLILIESKALLSLALDENLLEAVKLVHSINSTLCKKVQPCTMGF